jgi:hypothetical protein
MSKNRIDKFLDETVFKNSRGIPESDKHSFRSLLKYMLKIDENERADINAVVQHHFFSEYNARNYCMKKKPGIYSLSHLTKEQLLGVYDIVNFCKNEIKNRSLGILFMGIDIYLRALSNATDEALAMLENLPILCALIANKYLYWSDAKLDLDDALYFHTRQENLVYKLINGKMGEERYYNNCKTLADAQVVYDYFISHIDDSPNPNLVNYLSYNGEEFMSVNRVDPDKAFMSTYIKDAKIKDLNI